MPINPSEFDSEIEPPRPPGSRLAPLRNIGDTDFFTQSYLSARTNGQYQNVRYDTAIDAIQRHRMIVGAPLPPEAEASAELPMEEPPNMRRVEDDAHYVRLAAAHDEIERRHLENPYREGGLGRRESEFIDMLRIQKRSSMRAHELIYSEVPQTIANISHDVLRDIRASKLCEDLITTGRGGGVGYHYRCHSCQLDTPGEYAYFCNGNIWCAEHVPNLDICAVCHNLQSNCTPITNRYNDELYVCGGCTNNLRHGYIACRRCSRSLTAEEGIWIGTERCPSCVDSNLRDGSWRGFSPDMKWVGKEKGAIVRSTRIFSCEVEALTGQNNGVRRLSIALPEECGLGGDGSVHSDNDEESEVAFEIQTPKLAGKKGEECLRRAVSALHASEAIVNNTCGLHIHLDGKGIMLPRRGEYPMALIQLWKTHLLFEDVILSFLPYRRRSNQFCRLMAGSFKLTEIDICESMADVEKLWYKVTNFRDIKANKEHHYHTSRYFGVNFHSLLANRHLEIRYHSGTTNGRKMLEWANLHCLLLDACAAKKMSLDFFKEAQTTTDLRQKTDLLFKKIGLAESSKQYFYSRQKKFVDKKNDEAVLA